MDPVKQKKLPCSFGTARQLYDNRFRKMQELQLHVEVALQQALEAAAMTGLILCHLVDGVVDSVEVPISLLLKVLQSQCWHSYQETQEVLYGLLYDDPIRYLANSPFLLKSIPQGAWFSRVSLLLLRYIQAVGQLE